MLTRTVTDAAGFYEIAPPEAGRYILRVAGYGAHAHLGRLADFCERVERGLGRYITRDDIEAKGNVHFTSLLRNDAAMRLWVLRPRVRGLGSAVALLVALAVPVSAQSTVKGQILNTTTKQPVASASVVLLTDDGQFRMASITDAEGNYSMITPGAGVYKLRVDATGFNTGNSKPFRVRQAETVEMSLEIWSLAVLPAVTVTAEREEFAPGPLEGFYERMERGLGQFITAEDIEQKGAFRFTDALRNVPTINIVPLAGSTGYTVRFKSATRLRGCPPLLWLDNVRWGSIDIGGGPDRELISSEVQGIEAYSPISVPADFHGPGSECGVVVVWTKRAPRGERE